MHGFHRIRPEIPIWIGRYRIRQERERICVKRRRLCSAHIRGLSLASRYSRRARRRERERLLVAQNAVHAARLAFVADGSHSIQPHSVARIKSIATNSEGFWELVCVCVCASAADIHRRGGGRLDLRPNSEQSRPPTRDIRGRGSRPLRRAVQLRRTHLMLLRAPPPDAL